MKEVVENKELDRTAARRLAERYRYEFVSLKGVHLDLDLFHSIQVDLMFRYNFVPLRMEGGALVVAMADPSDLVVIDDVSALLDHPLVIKVAPLSEIQDLLKKSESSQRVLEEATEGFKLDLIKEDEAGEETITIEKITQEESSPIIRSILRHDPDKILVGEIRDVETAQIAIQSALTGHLVLPTVHENNVVAVLGHFLTMRVNTYNFVPVLTCILAQRLVRITCGNCQKPIHYSDQTLIESGLSPDQYRDFTFY